MGTYSLPRAVVPRCEYGGYKRPNGKKIPNAGNAFGHVEAEKPSFIPSVVIMQKLGPRLMALRPRNSFALSDLRGCRGRLKTTAASSHKGQDQQCYCDAPDNGPHCNLPLSQSEACHTCESGRIVALSR